MCCQPSSLEIILKFPDCHPGQKINKSIACTKKHPNPWASDYYPLEIPIYRYRPFILGTFQFFRLIERDSATFFFFIRYVRARESIWIFKVFEKNFFIFKSVYCLIYVCEWFNYFIQVCVRVGECLFMLLFACVQAGVAATRGLSFPVLILNLQRFLLTQRRLKL